jgi:hypothetical protein
VESRASVVIPLDDRVLFVSSLNCADFSSGLSKVAQTLDPISGTEFLVGGRRRTSSPETLGNIISKRIRSGISLRATRRPSSPSPAWITLYPAFTSARSFAILWNLLSSIRSIFILFVNEFCDDARFLTGVPRPWMQRRSGYGAVMYGRSVLVHRFCRLGAATSVFIAELQYCDGVLTIWTRERSHAVAQFD